MLFLGAGGAAKTGEVPEVWFPGGSVGKASACNAGDTGSLGQEDPLEEGMATHSSILAWRIQGTEEPGGLQSMDLKGSDTTEVTEHAHMHAPEIYQASKIFFQPSLKIIVRHLSKLLMCGPTPSLSSPGQKCKF